MGPFRVLQLSIVILMLFGSTWLVRLAGMAPSPSDSTTTWLSDRAALAGVLAADNADNNNNGGDNGNSGDNGNGGDNSGDNSSSNNNNSNRNNNGNGNGNDSSGGK